MLGVLRIFLSAVLVLLSACQDSGGSLREWRPEDHTHPAEVRPGQNAGGQQTASSSEQRQASIATLWRARCSSCHGPTGQKKTFPGPEGEVAMQDLTEAAWQARVSDADIARVIQNGKGAMPAFGPEQPDARRLNMLGVQALVEHIRALRDTSEPQEPS